MQKVQSYNGAGTPGAEMIQSCKYAARVAVLDLAKLLNAAAEYDMDDPVPMADSIGEALALICKKPDFEGFAIVELDKDEGPKP